MLAIEPLRSGIGDAISGDTAGLREDLRGLGFGGVMITFCLALAHVVVWYPAEILDLAAGYVYGFWGGLALVMAGWLANGLSPTGSAATPPGRCSTGSSAAPLRPARAGGRGGRRDAAARRCAWSRDPVQPVLDRRRRGARPGATFIWTTAVGYLPLTAFFVYLGSQLEELSPTDPLLWLGAAVLIALLLVDRGASHRRLRDRARAPSPPQPEPDT